MELEGLHTRGVAGLPPAKQEDVSPIPYAGISPQEEVFYLRRVGTVQQQLAWGSAHVYSQTPRYGPPALQ
ncbi:hypothetical protein EI555_003012 [Monodon monoceros]|uniref:Uncharacterized protein n=1 Tax=Monodon monoceros TaxID=40151 RepID=A0A4U1EB57_MONMO|nr:hypothetical protein EI555_003012 [Monodon monoceros]